jgi:hypothetical protein
MSRENNVVKKIKKIKVQPTKSEVGGERELILKKRKQNMREHNVREAIR